MTSSVGMWSVDGDEAPRGVDPAIPNVARMYDYYLGGKDHYAADRVTADRALQRFPELREAILLNRSFVIRAVHYLAAECGIRQFIDIGSGLPTQHNVHEVATEVDPECRVVYADYDRIVIVHARALLVDRPTITVVEADLREPAALLNDPETVRLIDFNQPVAILLSAVLHFVADEEDPYAMVKTLCDAMAPGSYLVITHAGGDELPARGYVAAKEYRNATAQMNFRSRAEILRFFDGLELVEPGLAFMDAWHPDDKMPQISHESAIKSGLGGVARKP